MSSGGVQKELFSALGQEAPLSAAPGAAGALLEIRGLGQTVVPALVAATGDHAARRFIEFFTAHLRNAGTRRVYGQALADFLAWAETRGLDTLSDIEPVHVAAYIESLRQGGLAAPTIKLRLAAIRSCLDFLAAAGGIAHNPAAPVRGPRHSVTRGTTPVLSADDTRRLLDGLDGDLVALRDRALIATLVYTFARIGAALALTPADYFPLGKRWWLRLHEKGGRVHDMPVHHALESYLDAYLDAAGLAAEPHAPLFRTARAGALTQNAMGQSAAHAMIRRRTRRAGITTPVGCHSFRATGITSFLANGGSLEAAQRMAGHVSPKTTKLYDRTSDVVTLDDVERIL